VSGGRHSRPWPRPARNSRRPQGQGAKPAAQTAAGPRPPQAGRPSSVRPRVVATSGGQGQASTAGQLALQGGSGCQASSWAGCISRAIATEHQHGQRPRGPVSSSRACGPRPAVVSWNRLGMHQRWRRPAAGLRATASPPAAARGRPELVKLQRTQGLRRNSCPDPRAEPPTGWHCARGAFHGR